MLAGLQQSRPLCFHSAIVVSCLGYCAGGDIERLIVERYIYTDEEYKACMTPCCARTSLMTGILCDVAVLVCFVTKSERWMCSISAKIDEEKGPVNSKVLSLWLYGGRSNTSSSILVKRFIIAISHSNVGMGGERSWICMNVKSR